MAETFGVGTTIIPALPYLPNLDCPQAGEIINSVRDMGPDPVYDDVTGEPMPDADGDFLRASTLYRWLTGGIRELTRRANWTVLDWTAMAQRPREQVYRLDMRFVNVDGCFCNQYRLMYLDELHTIFPSYSVAQPLWFSWHHRSDHQELSLWPAPDRTEPTAVLSTSIDPLSEAITLTTTAGFLPFGWVRIQNELMQYSEVVSSPGPPPTTGLRVVRRGVSGTAAALHLAGAPVEHLSIWCRGIRSPNPVKQASDCVELPFAFQQPLELYVLSKYREAEQDREGARSLMQEFLEATNSILADPQWQQPPYPMQARAYGEFAGGSGLAWGRVVVP